MHGSVVGCVPETKLKPAVALGHRNPSRKPHTSQERLRLTTIAITAPRRKTTDNTCITSFNVALCCGGSTQLVTQEACARTNGLPNDTDAYAASMTYGTTNPAFTTNRPADCFHTSTKYLVIIARCLLCTRQTQSVGFSWPIPSPLGIFPR